jgi:Protein of unknown function (DUF3047)
VTGEDTTVIAPGATGIGPGNACVRGLAGLGLLALAAVALAAEVLVEDWSAYPIGTKGIPPGWQRQRWGSPAYDFAVVEDGGRKVLHLKSTNDSSTISMDIRGKVSLKDTPVLEWSWKAVVLPKGADSRKAETDDQAAQLYLTWPRFPEAVRSRIIGYIWDTTVPAGTIIPSQKTGTVTYVVVRSGPEDVGKWVTERRNVFEDFRRIYGEVPDEPPSIISVGVDSNEVGGVAESLMGPILFRTP